VKTLKTIFLLGNDVEKTSSVEEAEVASEDDLKANIHRLFGSSETNGNGNDISKSEDVGSTSVIQGFDGVEFLMSWQRRIAESEIFFKLMRDEGFYIHHHGRCVYSFFLLTQQPQTSTNVK
jgi:hypothetical protein